MTHTNSLVHIFFHKLRRTRKLSELKPTMDSAPGKQGQAKDPSQDGRHAGIKDEKSSGQKAADTREAKGDAQKHYDKK